MPPKISSAEWEVMSVVWDKAPVTATEVFEALPPGHGWKQKTVNTFLTRLVEKGAHPGGVADDGARTGNAGQRFNDLL